jgi:histidinol-phosphate aminotransferase
MEDPPNVAPEIEERERLALKLASLGLDVLPSRTNFVMVRHEDGGSLSGGLMRRGLVVRPVPGGIRITVRDRTDDDVLVEAIAQVLDDGLALDRRSRGTASPPPRNV